VYFHNDFLVQLTMPEYLVAIDRYFLIRSFSEVVGHQQKYRISQKTFRHPSLEETHVFF
jgi:hypothetical protein